ncbi:SDR family NAD(P)-dependent oxidoreductase, partial [Pseudarthrobacter siccitolerans]
TTAVDGSCHPCFRQPLHGLVNNAGITLRKTVTQTEPEERDRLIGLNLAGSFLAIRALAPVMSDGGMVAGGIYSLVGRSTGSLPAP